jgi:DNA-binding XRE family transcriptional regulator
LLDITLSTCKALEMGSFAPNIETIRKWHKVFKKTYDWILDGKY